MSSSQDQTAVGMTFTATDTGIRMIVSTPQDGAVFTMNMDPVFAIETCQSLVAALGQMGIVSGEV